MTCVGCWFGVMIGSRSPMDVDPNIQQNLYSSGFRRVAASQPKPTVRRIQTACS